MRVSGDGNASIDEILSRRDTSFSSRSNLVLQSADRASFVHTRTGCTMTTRDLNPSATQDLLCFSHLRWSWVYQRPQHLLTRAARTRRVHYFEEPVFDGGEPRVHVEHPAANVRVVQPIMSATLDSAERISMQRMLLDQYLQTENVRADTLWYYTPMALPFTRHLPASLRVFDCMDELSSFAAAPAELRLLEKQLLGNVQVVFTGGWSLFETKSTQHANCHAMPSSVDVSHFSQARQLRATTPKNATTRPRVGYCGVIDERLDLELIGRVAALCEDMDFVFVGPVTKIDPHSLPQGPNIQYLGAREYSQLPTVMADWDAAWMPFALNESTRYISPTKTPEYLSAGLPVVSTPVHDVVRTWGREKLVHIAATANECALALQECLESKDSTWLPRVDRALALQSWDSTWSQMESLMDRAAVAAA